ncbi:hypothetical protein MKW94_021899 [Papaver nudicaule]|uniref:Plant heme peroxidase family profile domain-containing protein n=1 Tax=Papaver nudicaule TaxID=74823 RepID=A0AA41VS77_PAPNU|nr:hypothetical protein [Papaver nudicaule]
MGCDASVLLDSTSGMRSEKQAGPNKNSLRGFKVIDEIKLVLEKACPQTISYAVVLRGGPSWPVELGRKDSLTASFNGANRFIPTPNSSLDTLISNFATQGLDTGDLVALSGSHTMGVARCVSFKQRIYGDTLEVENDHYRRVTTFHRILRSLCPPSGRDNQITPLDFQTPGLFDNQYYRNVLESKGLLNSDNVLISQDVKGEISARVWAYATDEQFFFQSFVKSIIKMGNINVLTGEDGEIRRNCRFVN